MLHTELVGKLYKFSVAAAVLLPPFELAQRCHTRALRSFVVDLEAGQAGRLARELEANGRLPAWLSMNGHLPLVALRAPSSFALVAATEHVSSLWLPHITGGAASGGGTFCILFGKLGITPPPARDFRRQDPQTLAPSFLTAVVDEIRCVAQSLDIRGGGRERLETLHGYVASLQACIDDSSESGIARHVSHLGREALAFAENAASRTRRFAYRTTFLVHSLVMSGLIMSDAKLRDILLNSVRMLLPPALAKPLADVIRSPSLLPLPNKSTTSRRWVILDGAFILWTRRRRRVDTVYYAMVDSSTQGGKDYELIVLASIRKSQLVGLLDLVDSVRMPLGGGMRATNSCRKRSR